MFPRLLSTRSEHDTRIEAARFANNLEPGAIVLLTGDLGAGKTAFVRGMAQGLGIDPEEVRSPTFTLVHEHRGGRLPLVHVDLYRLVSSDLDDIGLDPDVAAQGVIAVEWAERLTRAPRDAYRVAIVDQGGDVRAISIDRAR